MQYAKIIIRCLYFYLGGLLTSNSNWYSSIIYLTTSLVFRLDIISFIGSEFFCQSRVGPNTIPKLEEFILLISSLSFTLNKKDISLARTA